MDRHIKSIFWIISLVAFVVIISTVIIFNVTTNIELGIGIIATEIASAGLFLNWYGLFQNTLGTEIQLVSETFDRIQEIVGYLYENYESMNAINKKNWDDRLFNGIEYFCFLVNKGYIRDQKLAEFFDDAVVEWFEEIFKKHAGESIINNPKQFEEFKLRYMDIKKKRSSYE